jgi:8-oxo-dGTP pyrophosphatase MutT (NUDIX family)
MRNRPTARVLLLDPDGRILLVRARETVSRPVRWFTPGGGIDPGETVIEAALREVREETGLGCLTAGPVVWVCEAVRTLHDGETMLVQESFVVATCGAEDLTREGWEPHEQALLDDMRWWTMEDLSTTSEMILPEGLAGLLPDVIAGRYPRPPLRLPPV